MSEMIRRFGNPLSFVVSLQTSPLRVLLTFAVSNTGPRPSNSREGLIYLWTSAETFRAAYSIGIKSGSHPMIVGWGIGILSCGLLPDCKGLL